MASKTGKMTQWINYKIRVTIQDRRDIVGQFLAFDRHMNLIIADSDEYRRVGGKGTSAMGGSMKSKDERVEKRTLGLVLLRGENIVSISIEAPPAPEENRNRQAPIITSTGPGIAKSAGRGLPFIPPAGIPTPGLADPVKGLGGPMPGAMQPGMMPKFPPVASGMPIPGMTFPPGMMPPPPFPGMMMPGMTKFPPGMPLPPPNKNFQAPPY